MSLVNNKYNFLKLASSGLLLVLAASAQAETFDFDGTGLQTLELVNNVGMVTITGSDQTKATVDVEKKSFSSSKCSLEVKKEGSKLIAKVDSQKSLIGENNCQVNFKINIPKKMSLDLKSGSGDIDVNGTEGLVTFMLGSGDITIDGIVQELKGSAGSGDIEVSGVKGATDIKSGSGDVEIKFAGKINSGVNIKTGTGDIKLNFAETPIKGDVQVSTGTGDATVYLPKDSVISSKLSTGLGSSVNELGNSKKAQVDLSLNSGVGDLKILKK